MLPLAVLLRALVADQQTDNTSAREVYVHGRFAEFVPSEAAAGDAHLLFAEFTEHVAVDGGRALPGIWAPLSLAPTYFSRAGREVNANLVALIGLEVLDLSKQADLAAHSLLKVLQRHVN